MNSRALTNLHDRAMDLREKAKEAERTGNAAEAAKLNSEALPLAREAADLAVQEGAPEPTRSTVLQTAASIALVCEEHEQATQLVSLALKGTPPPDLAPGLETLKHDIELARGRCVVSGSREPASTSRSATVVIGGEQPRPDLPQPGDQTLAQIHVGEFLSRPSDFEGKGQRGGILFADLAGSTGYKRDHSPIEGLSKTVLYNKIVAEQIVRHYGTVVKHLGDGIMGFFERADCERHAIEAGLAIVQGIDQTNKQRDLRFPHAISTHIGIHSGPVWMFKFPESNELDPQGTTVDMASGLCTLAGPQQVVCSEETFQAAGGDAIFPNASMVLRRYVKGMREPAILRVVQPAGYKVEPVPLLGPRPSPLPGVEESLRNARNLLRQKELSEALKAFEGVLETDRWNFEANLRIGEILIHGGGGGATAQMLERAIAHLKKAKWSRPESCWPWLLDTWARFKQFELTGDAARLESAIEHARAALQQAMEYMDLNGIVQAKTLLADLLRQQASTKEKKDERAGLLAEASALCAEVAGDFESALDRHRCNNLIVHALVRLAQGDTDYDGIERMIEQALAMDRNNPRAYEAKAKLVEARNRARAGLAPAS